MSDDQNSAVDEQKVIGGNAPVAPVSGDEREQEEALRDFSQAESTGLNMHVKVYSPFRDYFDGPAFSVTAENATGAFDVLPQHHNFISLLSPCELVVRSAGQGNLRITISNGLMHVKAGDVIVFLDV